MSALKLPVDLLVVGPPCPPWAGQGNHQAMNDPRAKVFVQVILWIIHLAYCGGLLCFIVENVPGVLKSDHGLDSYGHICPHPPDGNSVFCCES